jgi:hypothetical protein
MPSKLPEAVAPVVNGPCHDSSHSKPASLALLHIFFSFGFFYDVHGLIHMHA